MRPAPAWRRSPAPARSWRPAGNVTQSPTASAAGTLNVASGAEVYVGANLNVNDPAGGPSGTLNLDGGSIFVADNFTNNGKFNFTDGLLQVQGNFQPHPGGGI